MQQKIYLEDNDLNNFIMKPFNPNYIKFSPKSKDSTYIPYLLINEHIFMTLARDFGFDVPYNAIIDYGKDYHYIIKRYDRYNNLKIDHYEVLSLLGKHSSEKYDVSCKEVLDLCVNFLDHEELLKLFKFIVFSVIISHGDLHAKNISLIYATNSLNEKKMLLAPFYDISTVAIYKDIEKADIGIKIKNKKKEINLDDFIWLADKIQINNTKARLIVEDLSLKFIDNFKIYINKLPDKIKSLPFYTKKSIYKNYDTFEQILYKYYERRCKYIKEYLKIDKKNNNFWDF